MPDRLMSVIPMRAHPEICHDQTDRFAHPAYCP